MALSDERLRDIERKFNAERVRTSDEEYLAIYPSDYYDWQRAIEAEVRKDCEPLIRQMLEALESLTDCYDGNAASCLEGEAITAARAWLEGKP